MAALDIEVAYKWHKDNIWAKYSKKFGSYVKMETNPPQNETIN